MGIEIERKFLVVDEGWKDAVCRKYPIAQGYISRQAERTVRVRIKGEKGYLTLKGQARGLVRREFEYEIPVDDARTILSTLCQGPLIEKCRYEVEVGDHLWEVDVFEGENAGLVVAEIELRRPDEEFLLPSWVGQEVTGQVQYYNARLVDRPYSSWD